MKQVKVLFVCMGNICRSPTAEGAFRKLVTDEKLDASIFIDSAGTHAYHIGSPPDNRAQDTALKRDIDLSSLRGRKFTEQDYYEFDYLIAMDESNFRDMKSLDPSDGKGQLSLFMDFSTEHSETEVPDPYYGGNKGFERVFDMVQDASQGLLEHIRKHHGL
mgnify:FL=1